MVRVIAVWSAAPGNAPSVRAILGSLREHTLAEPGCRRFDVLESTTRPGRFVLLEEYLDEAARTLHLATAHFRTLVLDRAVPLLDHRDVDAYAEVRASHEGC